jgi:aminoglycoside/choline kinase family phosphotransferase
VSDGARDAFLAASPWATWRRSPLAGDASRRTYLRLFGSGGATVVVMSAPPELGEDVGAFMRIAAHLRAAGIAAPEILMADPAAGMLVIEDMGEDQFSQWLERQPGDEAELYAAAADVLVQLQARPWPAYLAVLDPETAATMTDLASAWFAPDTTGADAAALHRAIRDHFAALVGPNAVLSLRDYHAENLIWRPKLAGLARVGVLDFQDAFAAHPAYDLVSLLRDARRDVSAAVTTKTIARFTAATGAAPDDFAAAFAMIGVQRNLRILGIFARLIRRDGKPRYAAFMPRVRAHLLTDLGHPGLDRLRPLVTDLLDRGASVT